MKKRNKKTGSIKFPTKLLLPIRKFLSKEEKRLKKRSDELKREDPFEDSRRVMDNAAVDNEAYEQAGHERTVALKKEVDRKRIQIRKALARIKIGKYGNCEKCDRMIDTDRLMVMPEATVCIDCEKEREK